MTNVFAIDTPARTESHDHVRSYVERFVTLLKAAAEVKEDLADLRKEAKGNGFDKPEVLVELARRELESEPARAKRVAYREELERLEAALGVFAGTPLGQVAMQRAARTHVGAVASA